MSKQDAQTVAPTPPETPSGWRQADTDFDDFPAWDFDANGALSGTVLKKKTVQVVRRGEDVEVRLLIVETADGGKTTLWESTNLQDLFDSVRPKNEIVVTPTGVQQLSGNRTLKTYHAIYR